MWSSTNGCQSKCSLGPVTHPNKNKSIVSKQNVDSEREKNIAFAAGLLVGAGYAVEKCSNANGYSPQPYYFSPYAHQGSIQIPQVEVATVKITFENLTGQAIELRNTLGDSQALEDKDSITLNLTPIDEWDIAYPDNVTGFPFTVPAQDGTFVFHDDGSGNITLSA